MKEWVDYFRQHRPQGECSLCEVPLGPEKRAELLAWPAAARAVVLRAHLENEFLDESRGYSPAEALGLTLLWFAALYGREHASEGEIWPHVAQQFPAESRGLLFAQGQPRPGLKWALERACRRFELRHAFGRHGGQAYYLTVYLQFGFTRRGLAHLPQWLAGYGLPTAVRILLQESETFRQLWAHLQANRPAPDNPFWPQGWAGRAEATCNGVHLVWDQAGVHFEIDFAELFPGLEDGSYQLEEPWEWFQVVEGKPIPATVACELEPSLRCLSVSSLSGEQTYFQEIELWNGELQFWDRHGRPRNRPEEGGSVHLPEGWKVVSATTRSQGRWVQLGALPLTLQDEQGQNVVWSGALPSPLQQVSLSWESQPIHWLPHGLEGILRHLPTGTRVSQAELSEYFGSWHVRCQLPADVRQPTWGLRLQHQGRSRTVRAEVPLQLITWQVDGHWKTFEDRGRLDLGWLQHRPFRFLGDFSQYGLLEGHRFLGRPHSGTACLRGLTGYGAPVVLRKGPFNSQDEPDRRLISSLVHQHLLRRVQFNGDEFELELQSSMAPGPKHFLLFWDGNELHRLPYARQGRLPCAQPMLVALGYGGAWLGSFWTRHRPPRTQPQPRLAAHLMRWGRMPLLEFTHQALARQWMRGQELAFLQAWMEPEFEGLQHSQDEGWFEVMRALVPTDLKLEAEEARQLLRLAPWQSWLRVHPRLLEQLLSSAQASGEIGFLNHLLSGDLEARTEQAMGVDRGWLKHLLELYFAGQSNRDLEVALAFPTFQELVLRESLR